MYMIGMALMSLGALYLTAETLQVDIIVSPPTCGGSTVPLPAANISETEASLLRSCPPPVCPTGGIPWCAGRF
jgi:hypothetical protein